MNSIFIVLCLLIMFSNIYNSLYFYQLSHYNLFEFIKTSIKKISIIQLILFILSIVLVSSYFCLIPLSLTVLYLVFKVWLKKRKVAFNLTTRIVRLIIMISLLYLVTIHFIPDKYHLVSCSYFAIVFNLAGALIIYPIEYLIQKYYLKKAKTKYILSKSQKIGITGSYGKTTTKNILNSILKTRYLTAVSPRSYNTLMGLCKTINDKNLEMTDYLILEYGASHNNDIKKLIKHFPVDYAILTDIGPMHLETFKTMENIINTKFQLIEGLNSNGVGIINVDNKYIREYEIKTKAKIIKVSIDEESDYQAINIKEFPDCTIFDIKNHEKIYPDIKINLVGRHNIYNTLTAFALSRFIKLAEFKIRLGLTKIKQVEKRLEMKKYDKMTIIDDSFSANPVGASNAIEYLKRLDGKKIIITPGMVELGDASDEENKKLAEKIKEACDVCILDSFKNEKIFTEVLGNSEVLYFVYKSFKEAYNKALTFYPTSHKNILILNDLPDNY